MQKLIAFAACLGLVLMLAGCNDGSTTQLTANAAYAGVPPTGAGSVINVTAINDSLSVSNGSVGNISVSSLPEGVQVNYQNCSDLRVGQTCTISFTATNAVPSTTTLTIQATTGQSISMPFYVQWPLLVSTNPMQVSILPTGIKNLLATFTNLNFGNFLPNVDDQRFGLGPDPVSPTLYSTLVNASPYPLNLGQIQILQGTNLTIPAAHDGCSNQALGSGNFCDFAIDESATEPLVDTGVVTVPDSQFASGSMTYPIADANNYSAAIDITMNDNDSGSTAFNNFLLATGTSNTLTFTNLVWPHYSFTEPTVAVTGPAAANIQVSSLCSGNLQSSCTATISNVGGSAPLGSTGIVTVNIGSYSVSQNVTLGTTEDTGVVVGVLPHNIGSSAGDVFSKYYPDYQAIVVANYNSTAIDGLSLTSTSSYITTNSIPVGYSISNLPICTSSLAAQTQCVFFVKAIQGDIGSNPVSLSLTYSGGPTYTISGTASTYLYAGGWFTSTFDGKTLLNYIARWNGQSWQDMGVGINHNINAIAVDQNGLVYAAGVFTAAGNQHPLVSSDLVYPDSNLAAWNGSNWLPQYLGGNLSSDTTLNAPYASGVAVDSQNNVYFSGMFEELISANLTSVVSTSVAKFTSTSESEALGAGLYEDNDNNPADAIPAHLNAIAVAPNGDVYAGGNVTNAVMALSPVQYINVTGVAKWNGTEWSALPVLQMNSVRPIVNTITADSNNNVYVGGVFNHSDELTLNGVAEYDGSKWLALGNGVTRNGFSASVLGLAVDAQNHLYVGGGFDTAGSTPVNAIALWDGSNWQALGSGITKAGTPGTVDSIDYDSADQLVFVGGNFDTAGGQSAENIAVWNPNTQTWQPLGVGLNGPVMTTAIGSELDLSLSSN